MVSGDSVPDRKNKMDTHATDFNQKGAFFFLHVADER